MKNLPLKIAVTLVLGLFSIIGHSQEYNNFDIRYQNNIKGDLTFIGNNIVNRDGGTSSTEPEDAYDATGSSSTYNDWLDMQYIDVDSDGTTFSSSTATFTYTQANCNLIRYAGYIGRELTQVNKQDKRLEPTDKTILMKLGLGSQGVHMLPFLPMKSFMMDLPVPKLRCAKIVRTPVMRM